MLVAGLLDQIGSRCVVAHGEDLAMIKQDLLKPVSRGGHYAIEVQQRSREHNQETLKDGDYSKCAMKACVCHTEEERRNCRRCRWTGRCFVAPVSADCRHRKGREIG